MVIAAADTLARFLRFPHVPCFLRFPCEAISSPREVTGVVRTTRIAIDTCCRSDSPLFHGHRGRGVSPVTGR